MEFLNTLGVVHYRQSSGAWWVFFYIVWSVVALQPLTQSLHSLLQLIAMGDAVEQNSQVKHQMAVRLSAATHLLNLLIRLWRDMSPEEAAILDATLTPDVADRKVWALQELQNRRSCRGLIVKVLDS